MVQVLHLSERKIDYQAARMSEAIRRAAAPPAVVTVRTMGEGGQWRNAAHAAAALRLGGGPTFDLAHVWDSTALLAAVAGGLPVVFSASELPSLELGTPWKPIYRRKVHVVVGTSAARDACISSGVPPDRCRVIMPSVDWARIPTRWDVSLRAALGFSQEDYVVLAPGESTTAANHRTAVHAVSILHVLDKSYRVLLWGRGREASALTALAKRLGQPRLITLAEQSLCRPVEFEELLGAADLALITGSAAAAVLPVASCMAAALAIVAAASPAASQLLSNRHNAALVAPRPRLLAKQILELRENPSLAARLGSAALQQARHLFDQARFLAEMQQVYEDAAGILPVSPANLTTCP